MLIDTDVLIWLTRGHVGAAARLQTLMPWRISVVTYMELVQGCRNNLEGLTFITGAAVTRCFLRWISFRCHQPIPFHCRS